VFQEISGKYFKTQKPNNVSRAMWNVKIKVIPVINGGQQELPQNRPKKYLNNVLGNDEVKELQKTATLNTVHTLRKY
jgi:hypothetical protein